MPTTASRSAPRPLLQHWTLGRAVLAALLAVVLTFALQRPTTPITAAMDLTQHHTVSLPPPFPVPASWQPRPRPAIIGFGDSLTQRASSVDGFLTLLSHRYQRRADVLNRGLSGYNSDWALAALRTWTSTGSWPQHPSQLVVLCFGANDSVGDTQKQHVPIDRYKNNLRELIALLRGPVRHPLLMMTPPSTDPLAWAKFQQARDGFPDSELTMARDNTVTAQYAEAVKALGSELDVPVVDIFTVTHSFGDSSNPHLIDGLHFTPLGNMRVFEALVAGIEQHFPAWSAQSLPLDAPLHNDLSADRYEQLFERAVTR